MFTIQTERGRFQVQFRHSRGDIDKGGHQRQDWSRKDSTQCRGVTACTIYRIEEEVDERATVVEAHAVCHRNDNWSYAAGRKVALARALGKAFPKWNDEDGELFPMPVAGALELRRLFWDCYHVMSNQIGLIDPEWPKQQPCARVEEAVEALCLGGTELPAAIHMGANRKPAVSWISVWRGEYNYRRSIASASRAAAPELPRPSSPPESESSSQPSPG